jgi:hypothetical protein
MNRATLAFGFVSFLTGCATPSTQSAYPTNYHELPPSDPQAEYARESPPPLPEIPFDQQAYDESEAELQAYRQEYDPNGYAPMPIETDYGPPPLEDEDVPPIPFLGAVWVPGYWNWSGGWGWQSGRWHAPPHAGLFWNAPYYEKREHSVLYVGGHWRPQGSMFVPPPATIRLPIARANPGAIAGFAPNGPVGAFVPAAAGAKPGTIIATPSRSFAAHGQVASMQTPRVNTVGTYQAPRAVTVGVYNNAPVRNEGGARFNNGGATLRGPIAPANRQAPAQNYYVPYQPVHVAAPNYNRGPSVNYNSGPSVNYNSGPSVNYGAGGDVNYGSQHAAPTYAAPTYAVPVNRAPTPEPSPSRNFNSAGSRSSGEHRR